MLNILLIPKYGYEIAAYTTLVSFMILFITTYWVCKFYTNLTIPRWTVFLDYILIIVSAIGIGFILVTGFHLYSGWTFLNTMSFPDPEGMDLLLFFGMNFVYIVFYLVQIDFNDAPDSTVSVLEKVIGKNKFTTYLIESQFNLMIYLLFPLLALDITVLILALRR